MRREVNIRGFKIPLATELLKIGLFKFPPLPPDLGKKLCSNAPTILKLVFCLRDLAPPFQFPTPAWKGSNSSSHGHS